MLSYGARVLLDHVTFSIEVHDKIALAGSNGAGKTTLFKIINKLQEIDSGKITYAHFVSIGYLPQEGVVVSGRSVYDEVESTFEDVLSVKGKIEEASEHLKRLDVADPEYREVLEMIGDMEMRLHESEADKLKAKIERLLLGLGFKREDLGKDCGEFSGGWQMRIALAKLLLREPNLLMLDEPTNHLDLQSQRWLEQYLKRYHGALLIVSHDRSFLDEICDKTFHLSRGHLEIYKGNYSYFEKERAQRKELLEKAYETQQKQLAKTQEFIDRFRYKATKSKQVQSRIKAMEKVDLIELEEEESGVNFKFPRVDPSGLTVVELKGVGKVYDEKRGAIFSGVNLKVEKGDRVAIVGVNGAGKSTLARIIAGVEKATSGELKYGHNVKMSYYAQQQSEVLDPEKTVYETMEEKTGIENATQLRSTLGCFLFRRDDVEKPVRVLSGGEKCRLVLASILMQRANFLILDEPTNHLDMRSKDMLQGALKGYEGTLVVVSHDRSFLDPLVNKVWEVSREGVKVFLGNITHYLEKTEQNWKEVNEGKLSSEGARSGVNNERNNVVDGVSAKERRQMEARRRQELQPLKKELEKIEVAVEKLEEERKGIERQMSGVDFYKDGEEVKKVMGRYDEVKNELYGLMERWGEISERLSD